MDTDESRPNYDDEESLQITRGLRGLCEKTICSMYSLSSTLEIKIPESDSKLDLAARMKVTGVNQLWVADMTYVRLNREFVYIAVVLDAFSRKVVGWELDRMLATRLPLAALKQAIEARQPSSGLVHHSDQGIQYVSSDYRNPLQKHGIFPSISRPRTPLDNARCESFMRTLKREEIRVGAFQSLEELRGSIETFIERYYKAQRLHSA
jgi:putative transposase